ncbi:hypothetical protein IV80_GL001624 [Pediococcus cellicola]|uniref:Uncharacterized protein n=1 Tax=Pediococcus cellicola TaxID=319652 RepID=A0A0R2IM07_9LACO|nr:hypothetical protein IV80_GL001624 [Pediococcus cellicola]
MNTKDRPGHDMRYAIDSTKLRVQNWGGSLNLWTLQEGFRPLLIGIRSMKIGGKIKEGC